ncbi:hypothetical protein [Kaistia sp. UC242_56]|uniref:hypothetical protein n=1 Tax=Kaistia sp. UC242_56 TaxID=3374625 RepID=UPI0037ABF1FF
MLQPFRPDGTPKPKLDITMDRDLRPGIGYCTMADGSEVKILVPDQTPPRGAVSVRLSIHDYGSLMGAAARQ